MFEIVVEHDGSPETRHVSSVDSVRRSDAHSAEFVVRVTTPKGVARCLNGRLAFAIRTGADLGLEQKGSTRPRCGEHLSESAERSVAAGGGKSYE